MSLAVGKCIGVAGQLLPFHVAYVLAVHLAPLPAVTRLIDVCIYTVYTMRLLVRLLFGVNISPPKVRFQKDVYEWAES